MSKMIKRMARVIGILGNPPGSQWFEDHEREKWEVFWPHARAAIEAMREPTVDQMIRGKAFVIVPKQLKDPPAVQAGDIWRAMIDEALK